jgi:hypothetical protein
MDTHHHTDRHQSNAKTASTEARSWFERSNRLARECQIYRDCIEEIAGVLGIEPLEARRTPWRVAQAAEQQLIGAQAHRSHIAQQAAYAMVKADFVHDVIPLLIEAKGDSGERARLHWSEFERGVLAVRAQLREIIEVSQPDSDDADPNGEHTGAVSD